MAQTIESLPTRAREPDAEPHAIEAMLNYIVDDGSKIFTETGAPGANDRRSGGKPDPRRVTLRNGRHQDFILERDGFHFIRHDTKVTDFFDEAEVQRIYYPEMESAGEGRERGGAGRRLRPHATHGRRCGARGTQNSRGRITGAQRLHGAVWPAARARPSARGGRRSSAPSLRDHPGVAAHSLSSAPAGTRGGSGRSPGRRPGRPGADEVAKRRLEKLLLQAPEGSGRARRAGRPWAGPRAAALGIGWASGGGAVTGGSVTGGAGGRLGVAAALRAGRGSVPVPDLGRRPSAASDFARGFAEREDGGMASDSAGGAFRPAIERSAKNEKCAEWPASHGYWPPARRQLRSTRLSPREPTHL